MQSKFILSRFFALVITPCFLTGITQAADLKLLSAKKIWDAGGHNAFTDLTRFHDQWFCTFREAQGHVIGNGKIRVLTSSDGDTWKSAALLEESGIDLRDPKLSITPDNRLMLTIGGSIYKDKKLISRQPRVSFSKDGTTWTTPQLVLSKGDWLWRVTWHKGHAYGMDYHSGKTKPEFVLTLVESTNGLDFKPLQDFEISANPNEATARFLTNDDCIILARREGTPKDRTDNSAWIGTASPPYKTWTWHTAGMSVGGPNFIVLPNGELIAAGRMNPGKQAKTFVGHMTKTSVTPDLILRSGGDCSYPGMVWHDNKLWLTYYSSHEGKTSIYLAKIAVNP
ncbi:MAG: sialidase family protein [Limisphaerales bacterium]